MATAKWYRPSWSASAGGNPQPPVDPWEGMNPITKCVILSDSIMNTGINSSDITSLTMNEDGVTGEFISSSTWQTGNMVDIRGANSTVVNQVVSVTFGAAPGNPVQFKLTQDLGTATGPIENLNTEQSMGMKAAYGFTVPSNWFMLAAGISGKWPLEVHHAGQGSATCAILLSRIYTEVVPHSPSHVIIHAGTNDILNNGGLTNESIVEAIQNMCNLSTAEGIQAIVASIPPASEGYGANHATRRKEINEALKAWIDTQPDVFFVDTHSLMVDTATGYAKDGYLIDNVHPSNLGYWESRGPWVDMFTKHAVDYGSGVPNRIPNADFSSIVSSNNTYITGTMPSGCTILTAANGTGTTFLSRGTSGVGDGVWEIDITIDNKDTEQNEIVYLYVNVAENVSEQTQDKQELVACDFSALSSVDLTACRLTNNYQLNSATSITTANSFAYPQFIPEFGDVWFTLKSRPVYIKTGDTYGAYRAFAYLTLPQCPEGEDSITVKYRLRRPALLTITE